MVISRAMGVSAGLAARLASLGREAGLAWPLGRSKERQAGRPPLSVILGGIKKGGRTPPLLLSGGALP